MANNDAVERLVEGYLRASAETGTLTLVGSGSGVWDVMVPSYWKESIAVSLRLGERTLSAEAFFMRGPEDNRTETYHLLLQRNQRSGPWRFAANEAGDVMLLALLPATSLSEDQLEQLLGSLVTLTDETYVPYMKLGYERGLEEQVRRGGPGVDRPPPWAK